MSQRPLRLIVVFPLLLAAMTIACCDPEPDLPNTATSVPTTADTQPTAVSATKAPTPILTPTPVPIQKMAFTGLVTTTNVPSQVQVVFSQRDQEGRAILRSAEDIERSLQLYEIGPETNDSWEEIDYTEASYIVNTAENIDLEVVFVLDFTNSMAAARLSDGNNGVQAMLRAFEAALATFPSAHRIGVVEFHDRNAMPSVLSHPTTNRQAIRDSVKDFLANGFDSGSSRVWDSVVTGSNLFSSRNRNPRAVRALVFLSDGRDNSSVFTPEQAAQYARDRGVQLYPLGIGDIFQEPDLRSAAHTTDGAYFSAHDLNLVEEQLQLLVNDLLSQYQLTYITPRQSGEYRIRITLEMAGGYGSTELGPFDMARFYGADNRGVVQLDTPSFDRANQRATVFMRALHIPRNIDRFRFRVNTDKDFQVELVPSRDGGLLKGWSLSGPHADGWYELSSTTPLEFGSLGPLTKLTFYNITEADLNIPVEFDNSVYAGGKTISSASSTFGRLLDSNRWLLHGSAEHVPSAEIIQLTPAEHYQLGMLLHRQLTNTEGLRIEFSFEIGGGSGADGLALLLLRSMPDFDRFERRYHYGGGWGSRYLDGYAVVFDTFLNEMDVYELGGRRFLFPITDPSSNFVALAELGAGSDVFDITYLQFKNLDQDLSNSGVFDAEVELSGDGRLKVYLSNAQTGMARTLAIDHTIENYRPFDGYIAFMGATGGLTDRHFIHSVRFAGEQTSR